MQMKPQAVVDGALVPARAQYNRGSGGVQAGHRHGASGGKGERQRDRAACRQAVKHQYVAAVSGGILPTQENISGRSRKGSSLPKETRTCTCRINGDLNNDPAVLHAIAAVKHSRCIDGFIARKVHAHADPERVVHRRVHFVQHAGYVEHNIAAGVTAEAKHRQQMLGNGLLSPACQTHATKG